MQYIHQLPDWSKFHWDRAALVDQLAFVRHEQGRPVGHMEGLGFKLKQEAYYDILEQTQIQTMDVTPSESVSGIALMSASVLCWTVSKAS